MPTRLCVEPACPNPATYRGRCQDHAKQRNRETHRNRYLYNSNRWRRRRKQVLFEQPLCPGVLGDPCGEIAVDVHHIIDIDDGGEPWARTNLVGLCRRCHARLTRQEQATR